MAFVKFSRGLLSSYNNLSHKDPDTLYLVYESNNSETGQLYLGNKLISSVGMSSVKLSDLTDINIDNDNLEDGMLLQYNQSTGGGVWKAVQMSDVIGQLPSFKDNISIVESLNTIENPSEKDFAIIDNSIYIYDGEDWVPLGGSDLAERLSNLESQVGHAADNVEGIPATGLYKDIEDLKDSVYTKQEVLEQIENAAHLRYQIVSNISDIDVEDYDSVNNVVFLVPKNSDDNVDGYDEYFVINDALEKIGSWDIDLSHYVTDDDNRLLSADDKKKLESIGLNENNQAIIQAAQVGGLNEAIQNSQLIKSVEVGTFNITDEGKLQLVSVPSIDLSGYVQTSLYQAEVGNLANLTNRVSENSTLVEEINNIKQSIIWKDLTSN